MHRWIIKYIVWFSVDVANYQFYAFIFVGKLPCNYLKNTMPLVFNAYQRIDKHQKKNTED